MNTSLYTRSALILLLALASLASLAVNAQAQAIEGFPLTAQSFTRASPRGFGDRNNSWAQSMIWWNNNLYVGTSRQSICTSLFGVYEYIVKPTFGQNLASIYFPYPPKDPDLSCPADGADLALQGEIWRWSPVSNAWDRVFQSPATLDNPGPGAPAPPRTGKKLPYDISFRGFASHRESNGLPALYAFGVNSTILWDRTKLPPPRILRSVDGVNWTPLPQTPGTFLGDLPFNTDHSSFRSPASYNGKLFVLSGAVLGQGTLIASANPAQGNNAWFLATNPASQFYELTVFNGWLYLGGFDPTNGYAIFKTKAEGPPPYALQTVVPPGAYLRVRPSKSVVSMQVHSGRLYVGTGSQTEIIRINPDDTWDLVVGSPRQVPSTNEWKYPISGLDAGFGHTLNDHAWQMDDPYNYMYVGTYNLSTGARVDPRFGPLLQHNMGAHMYRTPDDWYYTAVTTNGFASQSDPYGGKFDYGFRTMASTPHGFFVGTANDYYGLQIFRATKRSSPLVNAPGRLDVSPRKGGGALLTWQAAYRALSYRVYRAEILPIALRDDTSFEGFLGLAPEKIPDTYVGPYHRIGTIMNLFFVDPTAQTGKRYMYYVVAEGPNQALSEQSNLVTFPLLLPSVTFAQVQSYLDRLAQRKRFVATDPLGNAARQQLLTAKTLASKCQIAAAISALNPQTASRAALLPDLVDIEVLFSKMVRQLQLYGQFPTLVQSTEFCTTR